MKTLVTNIHVLTMDADFNEYSSGYILFEDQLILETGSMLDAPLDLDITVIDGEGAIALPGMVNTHTHIGMIPFRSLGDDTPDRLTRFLFPLENACMTKELAYHSGKYAIAEMQLAGITTFLDMYYFEDELAKATDEMGSRAILGETILENACDVTEPFGGLAYSETFISKWIGHERITPAIAPHAPYTNTDSSLKEASRIARKYDVPFTIHLSEMDFEMRKYADEHGKTPVAYLADLGVLDEKVIAAHGIFFTDEDIEILKNNKVAVAHCIGANTKSAKGVAPVQKMLEAGLRLGLGTDGPSSGNTLDLFTQMRMFANFHKTTLKDRSAFPARDIVRLATIGGAEAIGLDHQIGSLEKGKKADFVLVETDSVNMFPIFDAYSALVYSANSGNVRDVIIDGKQVVKEKQLTQQELTVLRTNINNQMTHFREVALDLKKYKNDSDRSV
ncbi:amidohydrolase [Jeotgalibaca sp. MA1X17-3]|uniref:amidohydrolase n=1 Tax=Jeotgalibaca sp. MA1X17-3 TaxID=2908211 RepID=UPI001F2EA6EC|nr:amidohydrolase [Jeotgalibaca sp. MA1X17-3]UJF15834.1 amidohydrolase [Jeotgalibaca sp. MA1X17-3]